MKQYLLIIGFCLILTVQSDHSNHDWIVARIKADLNEKCWKATHTIETSNNVNVAIEEYQNCKHNTLADIMSLKDRFKVIHKKQLPQLLNLVCQKFNVFFDCMHNLYASLNECIDEKKFKEYEDTIKLLNKLKNFVCSENGNLLARFYEINGIECFKDNKEELISCGKYSITNIGQEKLSINMNKTIACDIVSKLNNCTIPVLQNCEHKNTFEFTQGIVDVFEEEFSCENDHSFLDVYRAMYSNANGINIKGLKELLILIGFCIYSLIFHR